MRVEVRLFANFREAAGSGSLELKVDGSRVEDVLVGLFDLHPELGERVTESGELRRSVRVLVNGELAGPGSPVDEGDEVALLPPVSGGIHLEFKTWLSNESGEYVLGEGGAAILRAVDGEGSVSGAARKLDMSNRYALERILLMERRAGRKLVERKRGGRGGGGSSLTAAGRKLLGAYESALEEMSSACDDVGSGI
ncbi:MAG: Small archaeal modifier protein 3 [Methanonatronarchaeales archaeon]|nr:Small archaeal modifier protein 3 [Methanonatronarchaeales archaeon]